MTPWEIVITHQICIGRRNKNFSFDWDDLLLGDDISKCYQLATNL